MFVLRDVEGLSTEETAEVLDVTVPTVKTRLHRARLALREAITATSRRTSATAGRRRSAMGTPRSILGRTGHGRPAFPLVTVCAIGTLTAVLPLPTRAAPAPAASVFERVFGRTRRI